MTKEKKLKLNYFIWGQVDGESKSFYLEPNQLDGFINGSGSSSIRQAIFQNSTLGQSDTSAVVTTMSDYGATYAVNGVECIGARLGITVYTKGSA